MYSIGTIRLLGLTVFLVASSFFCCALDSKKTFKLITVLYNETVLERVNEYIECLNRNLAHPSIDTVHVLYDTSKDNDQNILLNYLKSKNVVINYTVGRPTFGNLFALINKNYPGCRVIISNADIYFNETLCLLDNYNLVNKFLALTRWNVIKDGSLQIFKQYKKDVFSPFISALSQDVWIFDAPIRRFKNDNIQIGVMSCDALIADQANKIGLKVINPCLTLQCCHLHLSEHRNYDKNDRLPFSHKYVPAPWSKLV